MSVGEEVEKFETSFTAGGSGKIVWQSLKRLNLELPYELAILLLGKY